MKRELSLVNISVNALETHIDKYYAFCRGVIRAYYLIGFELQEKLTSETWDVLLKVNMGIANRFLKDQRDLNDPAESLSAPLIENLFELFLYSGTQSIELFDWLSFLSMQWIHRESVLLAWFSVLQGLTQRLLTVIYSTSTSYISKPYRSLSIPSEPRESYVKKEPPAIKELNKFVVVQLSVAKDQFYGMLFNISDSQVLYLWFRFLKLFESRILQSSFLLDLPNFAGTIEKSKQNFVESGNTKYYVKMLGCILKEFLKVSESNGNRKKREICFDKFDVQNGVKTRVEPRFPQSATFQNEFEDLYCISCKLLIE